MQLRKATITEVPVIWEILQYAIAQRKADGSQQWQDGYPNENSIRNDIYNGSAYVLEDNGTILLYAAVIFDKEPAYENIEGKWLTEGDYMVLHRVAASPLAKGKGIATQFFQIIEDLCVQNNVFSIKIDTNFDNVPMLKIIDRLGYTYCGEVYFRGSARKAFEKVLSGK
ncbi:GNAT family N-acetyltransferase [Crocinitomicaceae bacterium CZZ-1]|uniref:GNAT family N-acetyltransferase n=1 Tax=Taishania pollutisoli TaxID=2766479 RepID=A0A8J6PP27_9FLAO|nr:GNAT family N-acetyltransferase [Taishania pollutisoli]MBC9812093.1 GNAT family N-acetyltransferase [Taishania pollutisoli]MBX2949832.1 GNAT family N-acetyltransferase [Crocinitomicaceae bacterium]NGF74751.1 GNAT family N-acetyltransferase [Fluviicola sp. SGL-29]